MVSQRLLLLSGALLVAGLGGCASIPADWGRGEAAQLAASHGRTIPQADDAAAFTREALSRPLTADTAVQLALLNNPLVRSETARLGFAAADLYDAGRLANPVFSATRLSPGDAAAPNAQLTLGIAFNFVNLLFLPVNTRYAGAQFEAAKLAVAAAAVDLAADVEAAYYEAVGAEQLAQMREAVVRAAKASADLAQRFFDAGNISRRELALEQAAASQAHLDALSARAAAVEARGALNRLMGLSAAQDTWSLDARLAEPLPREDELGALLRLAAGSRLDVAAARTNAEALAARFGLERRTRLIGGIEIGVEREKDYDGAINLGPTLQLELPLFNWGAGRVAAARAALEQAEAELDARVLDSSNEVKLANARLLSAKARAESYRSALIPQREAVVEQMEREVNYMLIGVFELLVAKQQEYDAYAGYLDAVRDYWIARTELARAVGRQLPSSDQPAEPTLDPQELTKPKGGSMDHSGHAMGGVKGMDHSGRHMQHEGMETDDMPGMQGMDHGTHEAASEPEPKQEEQPAEEKPAHEHQHH
ncbi:MAG: TolC family protein [Sinimarinibacterium flocculans]|uniref:Cobalt-zinc-cadmium efflux system outer membrane protein n=1 Tax=Sinimarinibacterium flocculans TaxID=985250 RepID=A0A318E530_9GAMM|nr:TolC family protein [Sinimarinibacterium flocculans]MEC9365282.1 TolC family protein [Pseudomonadota bacterium]PXV63701.1 cobalt-zinc-cadmium efflux system outer membrane protein [Sinimarinibacterium flocculans]